VTAVAVAAAAQDRRTPTTTADVRMPTTLGQPVIVVLLKIKKWRRTLVHSYGEDPER
jgi:hypothetical protein